jgi:hypothetical protein
MRGTKWCPFGARRVAFQRPERRVWSATSIDWFTRSKGRKCSLSRQYNFGPDSTPKVSLNQIGWQKPSVVHTADSLGRNPKPIRDSAHKPEATQPRSIAEPRIVRRQGEASRAAPRRSFSACRVSPPSSFNVPSVQRVFRRRTADRRSARVKSFGRGRRFVGAPGTEHFYTYGAPAAHRAPPAAVARASRRSRRAAIVTCRAHGLPLARNRRRRRDTVQHSS